MMKVKDLMEELRGLDPETEVVCARDAEGNAFSRLSGVGEAGFRPEDEGSDFLETGLLELDEKSRSNGYTEEDVLEGGEPCVVLWPTV